MTYLRTGTLLFALATTLRIAAQPAPTDDLATLRARLSASEQRVAELQRARSTAGSPSDLLGAQRQRARLRLLQETARFSKAELEHIEALYQPANRTPASPEALRDLQKLLEQYPHSNRAGCARLYLAQTSGAQEAEALLRSAIATCTNCWYGDGVQVGAFARYQLAALLVRTGRASEAEPLHAELRTFFADALDHNGAILVDRLKPPSLTP